MDEGMNPIRYTKRQTSEFVYKNTCRGLNGLMLPNNLSKKDYDKLMAENSGEVVTYNIKDKK